MGRSISSPSSAVHRVNVDVSWCGQAERESGEIYYDPDVAYEDFNDAITNLQDAFVARYKSMRRCDKWIDREDRAIVENQHAYFGVSEYCGLMCVWAVPKGEYRQYTDDPEPAFSQQWVESIGVSFKKLVTSVVGSENTLKKIGTASNGESFYERV